MNLESCLCQSWCCSLMICCYCLMESTLIKHTSPLSIRKATWGNKNQNILVYKKRCLSLLAKEAKFYLWSCKRTCDIFWESSGCASTAAQGNLGLGNCNRHIPCGPRLHTSIPTPALVLASLWFHMNPIMGNYLAEISLFYFISFQFFQLCEPLRYAIK